VGGALNVCVVVSSQGCGSCGAVTQGTLVGVCECQVNGVFEILTIQYF
jgi:hypothetical protein